jgi:hypothetical protein
MKRGILARHSRAAGWCRTIGGLALPVLVLAAVGSRIGLVPGPALLPVLILGFSLALLALAVGVFALTDIWRTGAEGAGSAIVGLIYAAPVLLILAAVAAASFYYPRLTDVSTDAADPPPFGVGSNAESGSPEQAEIQAEAFPDVAPRLYAQPIAEVYAAARALVEGRGWAIVGDTPPLPAPPSAVGPNDPAPVIATGATAALQAVAATPAFGFADDVAIRLRQTSEGTRVDMRSASRTGRHDLGQNVRRIRSFIADLDTALQPDPNAPVAAAPVVAAPVPDIAPAAAEPAIE